MIIIEGKEDGKPNEENTIKHDLNYPKVLKSQQQQCLPLPMCTKSFLISCGSKFTTKCHSP